MIPTNKIKIVYQDFYLLCHKTKNIRLHKFYYFFQEKITFLKNIKGNVNWKLVMGIQLYIQEI